MRRYIKQKLHLEEPNPYVETLMGLKGVNLGEKTAKQLIEVFGSPWGVFARSQEELAEVVGRAMASKILRAIGRSF
jgi:excinuclease UvrABC nuclease subunit